MQSTFGKMDYGGDLTDASTDDELGFWFHSFPRRFETFGRSTLPTPRKLVMCESATQLIFSQDVMLFLSLYPGRWVYPSLSIISSSHSKHAI